MKNIVIIGVGNIGGRHLQALASLKEDARIQLLDRDPTAIENAINWFNGENPSNNLKLEVIDDFKSVSPHIDVAIIATSSASRAAVTEQLLNSAKVDNLILEKVLFQTVDDYQKIDKVLDSHGCKTWVNCPRRTVGFYRELAEILADEPWLQCSASGSNWGLGCNSVHFLDLFALLSGKKDIELTAYLESEQPSKRAGYTEYTGFIQGKADGLQIMISSNQDEINPVSITVIGSHFRCIIKEYEQKAELFRADKGWEKEVFKLDSKNQSRLTNLVVEDIFNSGNCLLTPYKESKDIHIPFIKAMLNAINREGKEKITICPIT